MISSIHFSMLCTIDESPVAHPMRHVDKDFDGVLHFFCESDSALVAHIKANPQVCLSYAEPSKSTYVRLSAIGEIITDEKYIDKYWGLFTDVWFENGRQSDNIALLTCNVYEAEYWDPTSKLVQLYQITKAKIAGEKSEWRT